MVLTPASLPDRVLRLVLWFVLAGCTGVSASAGGWPQQEGRLYLKAYGGVYTAGSYYDTEGDLIADNRFRLTEPADTVQRVVSITDEFDGIVGGLYGEYGLTKDLTLTLDVPVAHITLRRKGQFTEQLPDNNFRSYRIDTLFTLTAPAYYGIGARYRISASEKLHTSLVASFCIPPGFSSPIRNNPDSPFLSDGAFQVRAGLELGIPASFGWVALHALYNWRDEELKDEALFHAELGFNKVENAFFKFHMDVVQSMSSFSDVQFVQSETQLQENYVSAGASFTMFLSKAWFADVDYSVRIFGVNTWNLSTVVVGTGLVFDDL